jgi:AGZA family xanthine/uracil permease-like MFS transporter
MTVRNAAGRFLIDRYFRIGERGSTPGTEIRGGITTFVVMSYILFVNPTILSTLTQGQGPPFAATVTMTALAAGVMTLIMGIYTNYPFALASGLGLNAFVAFDMILGRGIAWQAAMGVVFIEGVVITVLVLTGLRRAVMEAIPLSLKQAISVGLGLFILFIGLVNAGLVRVPVEGIPIVDGRAAGQPSPPITLGTLIGWPIGVALIGLFLTVLLVARRVRGALLIGIVGATAFAVVAHAVTGADMSAAQGVQGGWPDEFARPSFETFGKGLNVDIFADVALLTALLLIFSMMLSDFFDSMGSVIGVGGEAGLLDRQGRLPRIERVLLVDSAGAAFGGVASASSVTTFVESSAGVSEGARTGLASVVTGVLFLAAILLAPIAGIVPAEATAPALIVVGFLMASVIREIDFSRIEEGFPALLTMTVMPSTFSITNGIGAGFVMHTFISVVTGRMRSVHWLMYTISGAFLLYFSLDWIERRFDL